MYFLLFGEVFRIVDADEDRVQESLHDSNEVRAVLDEGENRQRKPRGITLSYGTKNEGERVKNA